MTPRVYYTDGTMSSYDIEREVLARVGAELIVKQCRSEEEVAAACADADGLLVVFAPIGQRALSGLPKCRVAVRLGIGFDVIDLAAATEHGVCVANVPDYCIPEVSDHALALIMACARRIVALDRAVHAGVWAAIETAGPVRRLDEQVVGIVGFGRIGQRLARNAAALGFSVLAYDAYLTDEKIREHGAEPATLASLLERADYVSINCPLTPDTHHLIGAEQLAAMKREAFLVNTSRGPVVDEAALVAALREGVIAGAALDVLDKEPPDPQNPLLGMSNVIVTPHAAFYSQRAARELRQRAAQEVARVLTGRYPRSLVNPAVKDRLRVLGRELAED